MKKAIDFGAALGAKHYLCSVAYVPQLSYYKNITAAIKVLNQIVSYAKENGMKCGIVNCMMGGNYIRTPEQWKLVLDEVPGLGIKYDPSHMQIPRKVKIFWIIFQRVSHCFQILLVHEMQRRQFVLRD